MSFRHLRIETGKELKQASPGRLTNNRAKKRDAMIPVIQERIDKLSEICARYKVRRLFIFGSAAEDRFDPAKSDMDFLVEFQSLSPSTHSDNYSGLLEDLERLFGLPVDLLEPDTIRNPFLRKKLRNPNQ